jgi:glycosyltransferase involved in cell wall biosynthesis
MRIAYVVPGGVDPPGGERVIPFVHHLVGAMAARHEVTVIAVGHDTAPGEWTLHGARVVNVPVGRHGKADIARVLASVPSAMGRVDVVHGLWANLPGLAAVAAAMRYRVPSVVSVCGGELASVPEIEYGGGLRDGTRRLALGALRRATAVTVATEWMHRHATACGAPVHEIVPLGADLTRFSPGGAALRPHHLVHVAGLNRVKDQDLLLRAVALASATEPRLTLDVMGGDTLGGHHARLAEELGIADRVTFRGHVAHEDLAAAIDGAALHVLTSHHDAGPLAVLEAAACGVPTVGTRVGHVADFASLTPPAACAVADREPATLAAAILQMLSDDRRNAFGQSALAWARTHDADFTATTFELLYRRLTARSRNA